MLEVIVRSTHLDVMGHVNNAKYVEYLEWGRCDELEKLGFDLWGMVKQGVGFAVVNLDINFRREAFIGDILEIETIFREVRGGKLGIIDQAIRKKGDSEVVCDARVKFLVFDLKQHKSIPIPEEMLRLLPGNDKE